MADLTREQVFDAIHAVVASTVVSESAADAVMDLVADVELDIEGVLRGRIDQLRSEVARLTTESAESAPQPKVPQPEMLWTGETRPSGVDGLSQIGPRSYRVPPGTTVAVVVIEDTETPRMMRGIWPSTVGDATVAMEDLLLDGDTETPL